MAVRVATYALIRAAPFFLERGAEQTIEFPIRHGSDGSLVAPDSGTVTINRPNGTSLVSGAAVSVPSSTAQYTLTPAASETLGAGWDILLTPVIGGVTYPTMRQSAYLCEYVPPCVISVLDLYERIPELRARIPPSQGERGDNTGWQPQVDAAYYEFLQRMIDDGQRPWLVREVTGYRDWLLTRALQLCVRAISHGPDSSWAQESKQLHFDMQRAEGRLRFQYSDEHHDIRRAGSPVYTLAPVGRGPW